MRIFRSSGWLICALAMSDASALAQPSRAGRAAEVTTFNTMDYISGAISPDGHTYAYLARDGHERRIWLQDLDTGARRLLTPDFGNRSEISWSYDGRAIMYAGSVTRPDIGTAISGIWIVDVRSGRERLVYGDGVLGVPLADSPTWTTDGHIFFLTFVAYDGDSGGRVENLPAYELWTVGLDTSDARPLPEQVSTTVTPNGEASFLRDVVGTVFPGDTIELKLIPNLSHGSIVVRGRIAGNSITGEWSEQAYATAAAGRLTMHRFSHTTPELHEPPPPPASPAQDRSTWGKVRVRVWEASRNHYIIVTHELEFPDHSWVSAYHTHASGEGWGDTIELPPGNYTINLLDFPNGDKQWRVPAKSARRFTVATGQTTDVTIRLNLATGTVYR